MLYQWFFVRGNFAPQGILGNTRRHFLIVMTEHGRGVLLACSGQRSEMLPNTPEYTEVPPQQRITPSLMSPVLRLRNPLICLNFA